MTSLKEAGAKAVEKRKAKEVAQTSYEGFSLKKITLATKQLAGKALQKMLENARAGREINPPERTMQNINTNANANTR